MADLNWSVEYSVFYNIMFNVWMMTGWETRTFWDGNFLIFFSGITSQEQAMPGLGQWVVSNCIVYYSFVYSIVTVIVINRLSNSAHLNLSNIVTFTSPTLPIPGGVWLCGVYLPAKFQLQV